MLQTLYQVGDMFVKAMMPLILGYLAWQIRWCQIELLATRRRLDALDRSAKEEAVERLRLTDDVMDIRCGMRGFMDNMSALSARCEGWHVCEAKKLG